MTKKSAKKIFEFKNENYSVYDLITFYTDKRLKDFKDGEVTNLTTGECFNIKDIRKQLHLLNKDVIDTAEHLSYYEKSKLRNMLSDDENDKRLYELNLKLDNEDLNFEEIKELLFLEGDDFNEYGVDISLIGNNYIKLNQKSLFPKEIKDTTLGKFLKLLMLTTYENNVKRTNRSNSNNITKKELKEYLKISNDKTFSTIFQEMEKYNLLFRKQKAGKGFVIFINPIYANRSDKFSLDKTQYMLFKDKLEDLLPKRILTYLDIISSNSGAFIEVDD